MISKFSWLGVGLCAIVSLTGTRSYASSIDFGSCTEIVNPALPAPPVVCYSGGAGTSQIKYSVDGVWVTATGFKNPVVPGSTNDGSEELYVKKTASPGETGLGTMIDAADHEITDKVFVSLDFSDLWARHIGYAQLTISSLQDGEDFELCQGNAQGSMGVLTSCITASGVGNTFGRTIPISWGASNKIFGIRGHGDEGADVLLQGITFATPSPTPEPTSMLLFGTGIATVIVKGRRHNDKKQAAAN